MYLNKTIYSKHHSKSAPITPPRLGIDAATQSDDTKATISAAHVFALTAADLRPQIPAVDE